MITKEIKKMKIDLDEIPINLLPILADYAKEIVDGVKDFTGFAVVKSLYSESKTQAYKCKECSFKAIEYKSSMPSAVESQRLLAKYYANYIIDTALDACKYIDDPEVFFEYSEGISEYEDFRNFARPHTIANIKGKIVQEFIEEQILFFIKSLKNSVHT